MMHNRATAVAVYFSASIIRSVAVARAGTHRRAPRRAGLQQPGDPARLSGPLEHVATCGYNCPMSSTGIRELKDNLSRYVRRIEAGERMAITAHGRVVAELVPPGPE